MEYPIERMRRELADERIKHGVDYATTYKYRELRIFCHELYEDAIRAKAAEVGAVICELVTWASPQRG